MSFCLFHASVRVQVLRTNIGMSMTGSLLYIIGSAVGAAGGKQRCVCVCVQRRRQGVGEGKGRGVVVKWGRRRATLISFFGNRLFFPPSHTRYCQRPQSH